MLWTILACAGLWLGWRDQNPRMGIEVSIGIIVVCLLYALWASRRHALKGLPLPTQDPALIGRVERLLQPVCEKAEIPVPNVVIMPLQESNAFAAGVLRRDRKVGVTYGIANILDDAELSAVLAHEVSHLKRRDNLMTGWWTALIGLVVWAAVALFVVGTGLMSGHRRRSKDAQTAAMIGLFTMVFAIVAGVAAFIALQLFMRGDMRRREYLADRDAALWTGNTAPMISALQKIETAQTAFMPKQSVTAFSFSYDPVHRYSLFSRMFSTHPSTRRRISRLQTLQARMVNVVQGGLSKQ